MSKKPKIGQRVYVKYNLMNDDYTDYTEIKDKGIITFYDKRNDEYTVKLDSDGRIVPFLPEEVTPILRGFENVSGFTCPLPERSTGKSAGYDIRVIDGFSIPPGVTMLVNTGIKAYMQDDEYLSLHIRSSMGSRGIKLANVTGIIDSDYYNNTDNEGHILLALHNTRLDTTKVFKAGDKVAQGIFAKYLTVDNDNATAIRKGGLGSTGVN